MDRVHYRRYTPSKMNGGSLPHPEPDYSYAQKQILQEAPRSGGSAREKLIVQGIISGVILATVLVLNMLNNPFAIGLRDNLSRAISGHVTAEQVAVEVNRFLEEGLQVPEALPIPTLPGVLPAPVAPTAPTAPPPASDPHGATNPAAENPPAEMSTPRIDEDMLRELFGETDSLQTTAPGPIILPEL